MDTNDISAFWAAGLRPLDETNLVGEARKEYLYFTASTITCTIEKYYELKN